MVTNKFCPDMLPLDKTQIIFQRRYNYETVRTESSHVTFIVTVVLALLAVLGWFLPIPLIRSHPFYLLAIAFIVLVLGNLIKGL